MNARAYTHTHTLTHTPTHTRAHPHWYNTVVITAPCPAGCCRRALRVAGGVRGHLLLFNVWRGLNFSFIQYNVLHNTMHVYTKYTTDVSIVVSIYTHTHGFIVHAQCISFVSEKPIFALRAKHRTSRRRPIIIQNQRPGTVSFRVACLLVCVWVSVCVYSVYPLDCTRSVLGTSTNTHGERTYYNIYPACGEDHPLLA